MMMPVTHTTASGYAVNDYQGRSDDAIQWINEWQAWAGEAPPGSREYRDIAMQRLRYCLDHQTTALDLSNLDLTELPEHLPPFLEKLNVDGNQLIRLPAPLPISLKILYVRHNRLINLSDCLPASLEVLSVNHNQLTNLPEGLPTSIKELYVSDNQLTSLPERLPSSIKYLDAVNNQLTILPVLLPAFLEDLYVSHNQLTHLPVLPVSLETLGVKHNQLTSLPGSLPASLKMLDAGYNQLTNLPEGLPTSIKDLYVSDNQLINLPDCLPAFLEVLCVSDNQLTSLPERLPSSIKYLNVNHNQLTNLPVLPVSLEKLNVKHNQLMSLPDSLPASLKILDARDNQLTNLPVLPASLERLYVSHNQLTSLPASLPDSLRELAISHNQLTSFLASLPDSLRELAISYNQLTSLPARLPASLRGIHFDNNPLNNTGNSIPYSLSLANFLEKIWRWSSTIDFAIVQWSAIQSEENAAVFADFLQNLHQGKNIRNKELKGRVAKWLAYLAAEENRELRKQLFLVAQEAATSCVDRAAFYFNQMYILMIEDRLIKKGAPVEEVFNTNVGIFRLQLLERYAAAQAERRRVEAEGFAEDIEIYLAYQCLLKARLSLPIYSELQYEEVAKLTETELNAAVEWVTTEESAGFLRYLLTESTSWSGALEKWDSDKKAETDSDYLDALSSPAFERAVDKQLKEKALPVEDNDARRAVSSALARDLLFEKRYQLTREYLTANQLLSVLDRFSC